MATFDADLPSVEIILSAILYFCSLSDNNSVIFENGSSVCNKGREEFFWIRSKIVLGLAQRVKTFPLFFSISIIPSAIGSPPPQEIRQPDLG